MPVRVTLGPRRNVSVSPAGIQAGGGLLRPNARRAAWLLANGSGAMVGSGETQSTAGTITNVAPTASVPWVMENFATTAVLNNQAIIQSAGLNHRWSQRPLFQSLAAPGASIAVGRWWLALVDASFVTILGTDTPGASAMNGAGFRYSTAAGDTTWKCATFNGALQTVVDSGVTVAASAGAKFEIADDTVSTVFKINEAVVATITATRPAASVVVRHGAGVQTLEAVIKTVSVGHLYVETD